MKLFSILVLALLAHAGPLAEPDPVAAPADLERRAVTCHTTGSNVKYRRGPRTSCDAVGQYGAAGTRVSVTCFNRGERINNNPVWYKSSAGWYSSAVYLDCPDGAVNSCGSVPSC